MATYSSVSAFIGTTLAPSSNITAEDHKNVELAILAFARDQWLPGDIKEIDCTDAYIAANFETTGIGKVGFEREGWAICNGYDNLTKNRTGRVSVGYGSTAIGTNVGTFTSIGTTLTNPVIGGEKDHALLVTEMPPHRHSYTSSYEDDGNAGIGLEVGSQELLATQYGGINKTGGAGSTSDGNTTNGATVPHNNMQPYIVTLFIQKL